MTYKEENKQAIQALVNKAKARKFFPLTKGAAILASKCPHGCGISVLTFRHPRGRTLHKCFRCGKTIK